jgi:hypothetical protein
LRDFKDELFHSFSTPKQRSVLEFLSYRYQEVKTDPLHQGAGDRE